MSAPPADGKIGLLLGASIANGVEHGFQSKLDLKIFMTENKTRSKKRPKEMTTAEFYKWFSTKYRDVLDAMGEVD